MKKRKSKKVNLKKQTIFFDYIKYIFLLGNVIGFITIPAIALNALYNISFTHISFIFQITFIPIMVCSSFGLSIIWFYLFDISYKKFIKIFKVNKKEK